MDNTLEYMKKNGVPLTRSDYLDYAYLGNPPEQLTAEEEEQLPEEFRMKPSEEPEAGVEALKSWTA